MRTTRISSFDDGVNCWRMVSARPAPALRRHVRAYTDYWERTGFLARRELASTQAVLIFNLAEPAEIVDAHGRSVTVRAGEGFIAGIADGSSISRSCGTQAGIHVFLDWPALARLCAVPFGTLANRVAPADAILGGWMRSVGQQLLDAPDAEARFAVLDAVLGQALCDGRAVDRRVIHAAAQIAAEPQRPLSAIAQAVGLSQRHFIARFREETGFAPMHYRRLLRFERFTAAIIADPAARLADLAQDAGFFDEPHLAREVRAFAGLSPGALRSLLLPGAGGFLAD